MAQHVVHRSRVLRIALTLVLLTAGALVFVPMTTAPSVQADDHVLVVSTTADAVDADPGDGQCSTTSGACSLRAAIQEANARAGTDVIEIPEGVYTLTLADTGTAPEPPEPTTPACDTLDAGAAHGDLDITCPVLIVGAGSGETILDGGVPPPGAPIEQLALDRLFEIHQSAGAVEISDLTVRDGYHPEAGGAIANSSNGTVKLRGIDVETSYATTAGGGIYNGEPLEIECPEPCAGGAPRLELHDVTVSDNTTGGEGGGVYVQVGTLTATDSTITGNQAGTGGGLFNGGEITETGVPSTSVLTGVTFTENLATGAGGGIFGDHLGSITVTDSNFSANTSYDYGGALAAVSKSTVSITGTEFTGNFSTGEGGAVFVGVERAVTIRDSSFAANEAGKTLPSVEVPGETVEGEGGGGGLFAGGSGPVVVTGSSFTGNTAVGEGGGLAIENNSSFDMSDSVISGNHGESGGGVENAGMRVTFTRVDVFDNEAEVDGGGIEGNGSGPFTMIDSNIYDNTAVSGGGFANHADGTTLFQRVAIYDNRAVGGGDDDSGLGGGIFGLGDAGTIFENITLTGNFAQTLGGGIYIDADAAYRVENSTISRNVAPVGSGVGDEGTNLNVILVPSLAVVFRNTIVAENLLSPDCNFPIGSEGGNLEDGDSCYFRGPRDRSNASGAGLDAIADNGGNARTMRLQPDSLAVDAGVEPCPATDARGVTRPRNDLCDSGAFEFEGPFPPADTTDPETQYVSGPFQDTLETSAFTFTGTDNVTAAHELLFECRLLEGDPAEPPEPVDPTQPVDPLDPTLMWHGCPSPWQVKLVEEGQFTFEVRAIDRAGNVDETPAVHTFGGLGDFDAPNTIFTTTPANPSAGTTAVFGFTGDDGAGTPPQFLEYECRIDTLDPAAWLECTSPTSFSNLAPGEHTVQVRATDGADNVDPTPATYTWTVGTPTSCEDGNITLFAVADTYVDEASTQETFGIATELVVRSGAGGNNAHTLVRFVMPTDLPDDCELESARLRLYSSGEAGRTLQAVPIAAAWAETGTSWQNQPGTAGDPASTTSGDGYREWDVTDRADAVIEGAAPDHGWLIRDAAENSDPAAEQSFTSRHLLLEPPETQAPQLILRFDGPALPPPPAPPAPTPAGVSCGQTLTVSTLVTNDLFDCPFDGLVIGAPNIVVDLGGHTVDGLDYMLTGQEEGLPAGIRNLGHDNVVVRNGTVQQFGQGVQLAAGAAFNVVENLTIDRNAVAGIELVDADNGRTGNVIRDNLLMSNGETAIWLLGGSEGSQIVDNSFLGNAGMAIHLWDASHNLIQGNEVSGTPIDPALGSDGGIMLEAATDNEIVGNHIAETGDAGVVLNAGSHRNHIEANVMTAAGDAGVIISDSDSNVVLGNTAHLGSDAGVSLSNAHDGTVESNDVRFNPTGVDLSGSNGNDIEGNNADFASGNGIAVSGLGNEISENTANNTLADGISVEAEAVDAAGLPDPSIGNEIEGNTTNGNLGSGITVGGVGHTIADNTANSNAGWGIDAAEGNVDGGGNTASGNGEPPQCTGVVCGAGAPAPPPAPDTTAPDTSFVSTPPNPHGMLTTVQFTFTGTDTVAPATALRYECRLDADPDAVPPPEPPELEPPEPGDPSVFEGENWVECANPVTFQLLTPGEHTFEVRALDPAQNFDATPASFTWTVTAMPPGNDTVAPTTAILGSPADPTTDTSATFRFGGSDNLTPGGQLTYLCTIDGDLDPCVSPVTYTGLGLGEHTFAVHAVDAAGNPDATPATYTWTVEAAPPDVTAPQTTIDVGPDLTTVSTVATFSLSSDDPVATFECRLDSTDESDFEPCTSPAIFAELDVAEHRLDVRARDAAGNADPTPASFTWTVTAAPVSTAVACGQVLTQSVRITNHLVGCPADGLVVGADGITVDLDGFSVAGLGVGAGVRNDGFDSVTVRGGTVTGFEYGVLLNPGTALGIVDQMVVQLNEVAGIQLANADNGAVGNILRDNNVAGNGDGIGITAGTSHTLVRGNTVSGSSLSGIHVVNSTSNRLEQNVVAGTAGDGVLLVGARFNEITGTTVVESGGDAIALTLLSNGNRVTDNDVSESQAGVLVSDSAANEITGTAARALGGPGLRLERSNNNVVRGNDLRFSSGGIELLRAGGNRLEANNTSETDGDGIALGDTSLDNVIVLNTANFNGGNGITVTDQGSAGAGNMIDRNTTNNNVGDGIDVTNVGHIIAGNVANSNGGWGITAAAGTVAGVNIDGGGNKAVGNVELLQCQGVVCDGSPPLSTDPLAPETSITGGPPNPSVFTSASFSFTGFDNATDVTFQCRLDSTDAGDFQPCTSPQTYAALGLGQHKFEVRAVDFSGNVDPTPASTLWDVIEPPPGIAPNTTINSAPDATTVDSAATFTFSSDEPGTTFRCSLDGAAFTDCSSPQTYSGLAPDGHTFAVRAVDIEGLEDASPATFSWTIGAPPVAVTVTCGQVLTQSTLVTNDLLDCPANGLVVGADGITVDLGGHTIDGIGLGAGVLNAGFESVAIRGGTVQEFDVGVQLEAAAASSLVSDMTALLNQVAGVQLTGADNNTVRTSSLSGNAAGIALLGGATGNTVRGNTVGASSLDGISVLDSAGNLILDNEVSASSGAAISVTNSDNTLVSGNTLEGNSGAGVELVGSDAAQLIANTVAQSGDNGILLTDAQNNLLRGNDVRFNPGGIGLSASSGNRIESNHTGSGSGAGIELADLSFDNEVVGNLAIANDAEGISAGDVAGAGQGNLIQANTASNNSGDGIFAAAGHTITGNTANFNDGWGIFAEPGAIDGGGNKAVGNTEPLQCSGVVCEIGVNPGAPDTTLLDKPTDPSNSRSASFTFVGTDDTTPLADLSFECRFDSTDELAWAECENPYQVTDLAPGEHTVQVRAVDLQGNVDPTPAEWVWDYVPLPAGVAPDTTIETGPPNSPSLEVFFKFTSSEPDSTFECRLDSNDPEAWAPCASEPEMIAANFFTQMYEFEPFDAGEHTFEVRAIDADLNIDPTPATHTWNILGLVTTITAGPAFTAPEGPGEPAEGGETEDTTATFEFHANVSDATFECALDVPDFQPCTSPVTYPNPSDPGLSVGEHVFQVIGTDPEGELVQIEETLYEWTVLPSLDVTPPDTTILTAPADGTSDVVVTFTGTDIVTSPNGLTFECRVDSNDEADFAACVSPVNLVDLTGAALAPGPHWVDVRAIDLEDNVDPTPDRHEWTVSADTTAPLVAISSGPAPQTVEPNAEFVFAGTDNVTSALLLVYECSVDGAAFEPCVSPAQAQGQLPGEHEFAVRAVDLAGNVGDPAVRTWTVVGPPVTTFSVTPPASTADITAVFEFAADQGGATYECALNGSDFVACTSPITLPGLGGGGYTFAVRATNSFGLVELTPAQFSWTITGPADTTPPDTEIVSSPPATGAPTTATFAFTSTELGSTFECSIDGADFTGCESPKEYADRWGGQHTFAVRAVDMAGNPDPTPAEYGWTVLGEPTTTIDLPGPESPTLSTEATFTFTSSANNATFMCGLDEPPFVPCTSPWTYTNLEVGDRTFLVYSIADGFTDSEGDEFEWTIVPPLETTITSGPPATTMETTATFAFSSSIADSTFQCALDTAAFAACTSPHTVSAVPVGAHTMRIQAIGPDGAVEAEPESRAWTVQPPPLNCGGPFTITANADSWVNQGGPTSNNGGDSNLKVTSKSGNSNTRALVKFAMPALPAGCVVQSASLNLFATTVKTGRTLQALRVTGSWTENGVTWANQPATAGSAATVASGSTPGLRTWTVTGQVQSMYNGGVQQGFLIRDASENSSASPEQVFNSRTAGANRPQLVLTFAPAP